MLKTPRPTLTSSSLSTTGSLAAGRASCYASMALVCMVAASSLVNGQSEVNGQTDLVESVNVRVVNVDVVVTDKKGNPVRGLKRSDFRVREDGKDVVLSNFFSYAERAASTDEMVANASMSPEELANLPKEPFTLAIYIDERNTQPDHRERVLQDIEKFLRDEKFSNADLVVASYRNRLMIHAGPTRNLSKALATLRETPKGDPRSLEARIQRRSTLAAIVQSYEACETAEFCNPCQDNWGEMISIARDHATGEQTRTYIGIGGLADLVGTLSGLDGRKAVLYVGDGFQQRGGYATVMYVADLCAEERHDAHREAFNIAYEYESTSRIDQLAAYANGNRVTFYMLDAGGVRANAGAGVSFGSRKFAPTAENDRIRIENAQASHAIIAGETGGKAILNANRPLEALHRLSDELSGASYSLGFVPSHEPTGRVHLLKVDLVGKAAKGRLVRHRRSYQDKKLEARLVDRLVSSLYLDNERNPLAVRLSAGATAKIKRKIYDLPVRVLVPESAFLLVPGPNGYEQGRARLWLSAVSENGERKDMRQRFIALGAAGAQSEDGFYRFVVNMSLEEGTQTIAVGIRDEVTQSESLVRMRVRVPNLGVGIEAEELRGLKTDSDAPGGQR